ncbi:MAG: 50S ribosomal protein L29 [Actinomycetota bacterium]
MTKTSELRDLSIEELQTKLSETKEELFNMRFQNATGQLDNYKRLGHLRKEIARLNTLLRQHELGEVGGETGE